LFAVAKSARIQRSHFVEFDQFLHRVHPPSLRMHESDQFSGSRPRRLRQELCARPVFFGTPASAAADHHLPKNSEAGSEDVPKSAEPASCRRVPQHIAFRQSTCILPWARGGAMAAITMSFERTAFVTLLHFCRWCGRHTRHELQGRNIRCLDCADRVLMRELDRD
jgi:DNA-directed RNA polymerase subunit RPC12/RpoP